MCGGKINIKSEKRNECKKSERSLFSIFLHPSSFIAQSEKSKCRFFRGLVVDFSVYIGFISEIVSQRKYSKGDFVSNFKKEREKEGKRKSGKDEEMLKM